MSSIAKAFAKVSCSTPSHFFDRARYPVRHDPTAGVMLTDETPALHTNAFWPLNEKIQLLIWSLRFKKETLRHRRKMLCYYDREKEEEI